MDASSGSAMWYRRSKPQGKLRRRVQDLRIPSSSYLDFLAGRPTLDLSHNESARLAADSLLSRGLEGYEEVLDAEGEVDFLSELEKIYILENGRDGSTDDCDAPDDDDDRDLESLSASSQSGTRCPTMSTDSGPTVAGLELRTLKDSGRVPNESSLEIYFQSDSRAAGMKDLVREFIRRATMALAIVMDGFSDVELLCDLLEASRKRNVSVHLLLDHLNLGLFVSMWQELGLISKDFPKLSVRSVDGQTYCAKTGRKLTGQVAESFIITDWTEALTGSYSFSWLSWQVHRSFAVLVKGSAVKPFQQEFHRLYSSSKPVPGFVTYITVPHTLPLCATSHAAQNDNDDVSKLKLYQMTVACRRAWNEDAQGAQTKASELVLSDPQSPEFEQSKGPAAAGTRTHENPPQLCPKPAVQTGPPQNAAVGKPKQTVGAVCAQRDAPTHVEHLEKNQNQIQSHVSQAQSPLTSTTVTTAAENTARVQESNPVHAVLPVHRTAHYQSPFKANSNLEQHNMGPEDLVFQQRNRLMRPLGAAAAAAAGQSAQRRQWQCSLSFKQRVDFVSDQPKVMFPSTSQAKTGLLFPQTLPRAHMSGLQTKMAPLGTSRGQDQLQRHHHSHSTAEAPGSAPTERKPQLQSDPKLLSSATGAKLQLQPHASQQMKPPPRLTWMPRGHAARPRPMARHSSFVATYGPGHQAGWRPSHGSVNPLGRSRSMNDRYSAGFRGAGHNPNITNT